MAGKKLITYLCCAIIIFGTANITHLYKEMQRKTRFERDPLEGCIRDNTHLGPDERYVCYWHPQSSVLFNPNSIVAQPTVVSIENEYDVLVMGDQGEEIAWFNHNGDRMLYIQKGRESEVCEKISKLPQSDVREHFARACSLTKS